jgi:hypothetical protein
MELSADASDERSDEQVIIRACTDERDGVFYFFLLRR